MTINASSPLVFASTRSLKLLTLGRRDSVGSWCQPISRFPRVSLTNFPNQQAFPAGRSKPQAAPTSTGGGSSPIDKSCTATTGSGRESGRHPVRDDCRPILVESIASSNALSKCITEFQNQVRDVGLERLNTFVSRGNCGRAAPLLEFLNLCWVVLALGPSGWWLWRPI